MACWADDYSTSRPPLRASDKPWTIHLAPRLPRDTVFVFYAGHGTRTHELVPYDANIDSIGETTIPMAELSQRLKTTAARASVVVLDCCFSGAAPARVLQGLPVARAGVGFAVTDLGGNGRVVLAAAKDNEEALERGQHGLFTAAILQALKEGANWLDIGALMAEVAKQVRAEASRIGHEQTPVWAGLIEGGLDLPPLKPGALYGVEFPDTTGIVIRPAITELAAFRIPVPILDAWRTRFSELNTIQLSAVNDYRVLDDKSLLVVAPDDLREDLRGRTRRRECDHRGTQGRVPAPIQGAGEREVRGLPGTLRRNTRNACAPMHWRLHRPDRQLWQGPIRRRVAHVRDVPGPLLGHAELPGENRLGRS